jgi:RHS repeat-associated protein
MQRSNSYDGFGNLLVQNQYGSAPYYSASPSPTTNQLGSTDANGNTTSYLNSANVSIALAYDVMNRLTTVGGYQGAQYSYAPGNKRVWRGVWTSGTLTTDEVTFWSVSGQKLATYQLSITGGVINGSSSAPVLVATQTGTNYYFGRKLLKNASGYVVADRLGSIGKYYPYGQEKPSATTNGTEKFTGYFRDAETGLDYADQRFHNPGTGRFLTPDPHKNSAGPADPGSWNRYAYVGGDPINYKDPTGRDYCDPDDKDCDNSCYINDSCETGGDGGVSLGASGLPPDQVYINDVGTLIADGVFGTTTITGDGNPQTDVFQVSLNPASLLVLYQNGLLAGVSPAVIDEAEQGLQQVITLGTAAIATIWAWIQAHPVTFQLEQETETQRLIRCTNEYAARIKKCESISDPRLKNTCRIAAKNAFQSCMGNPPLGPVQ